MVLFCFCFFFRKNLCQYTWIFCQLLDGLCRLGSGGLVTWSGLTALMPWDGDSALALVSEDYFKQKPGQNAAELREAEMELGTSKLEDC